METLVQLLMYGVPVALLAVLGLIWLSRSVVKEVSLKDVPQGSADLIRKELAADALEFQLAIAEDLDVDAATLNSLQFQAERARSNADATRRRAEQEEAVPAIAPWRAPVLAILPENKNEDGSGQER